MQRSLTTKIPSHERSSRRRILAYGNRTRGDNLHAAVVLQGRGIRVVPLKQQPNIPLQQGIQIHIPIQEYYTMKKFLLLAAMGLLVSSSAFAVEFPNENGTNNCTACGDESATSTDITVCAGVRVPLCVLVEDNTLTFPCLRRPLTSYATHHTDGWSDTWTIDPSNATQQSLGNTAKIRIQGDADDEVKANIVQGTNVVGNKIWLQHTNTGGQFSTGPHALPASGTGTNPDYLIVTLMTSVTQTTGGPGSQAVDQNNLDGYTTPTTPYPGDGLAGGTGAIVGPNTNVAGSYTLSHNDGSGFLGTGGLTFYFGGSVATQAGQQRGQYSGNFKVRFDYAQ